MRLMALCLISVVLMFISTTIFASIESLMDEFQNNNGIQTTADLEAWIKKYEQTVLNSYNDTHYYIGLQKLADLYNQNEQFDKSLNIYNQILTTNDKRVHVTFKMGMAKQAIQSSAQNNATFDESHIYFDAYENNYNYAQKNKIEYSSGFDVDYAILDLNKFKYNANQAARYISENYPYDKVIKVYERGHMFMQTFRDKLESADESIQKKIESMGSGVEQSYLMQSSIYIKQANYEQNKSLENHIETRIKAGNLIFEQLQKFPKSQYSEQSLSLAIRQAQHIYERDYADKIESSLDYIRPSEVILADMVDAANTIVNRKEARGNARLLIDAVLKQTKKWYGEEVKSTKSVYHKALLAKINLAIYQDNLKEATNIINELSKLTIQNEYIKNEYIELIKLIKSKWRLDEDIFGEQIKSLSVINIVNTTSNNHIDEDSSLKSLGSQELLEEVEIAIKSSQKGKTTLVVIVTMLILAVIAIAYKKIRIDPNNSSKL